MSQWPSSHAHMMVTIMQDCVCITTCVNVIASELMISSNFWWVLPWLCHCVHVSRDIIRGLGCFFLCLARMKGCMCVSHSWLFSLSNSTRELRLSWNLHVLGEDCSPTWSIDTMPSVTYSIYTWSQHTLHAQVLWASSYLVSACAKNLAGSRHVERNCSLYSFYLATLLCTYTT